MPRTVCSNMGLGGDLPTAAGRWHAAHFAPFALCRRRNGNRLCRGCCHQVGIKMDSILALVDCLASLCIAYSSAPNPSPCCPPGRGLRTAMVEREDFAAGTSSRSTKLVHGGVRYLEKVSLPLVSRCLAVGSG